MNRLLLPAVLITLISIFCTNQIFAHGDDTPPLVWKTVPQNGATGISPGITIHVFLTDQGWSFSGVNPDTVKMRLNGEYVQVAAHNLYLGVWVTHHHQSEFPHGEIEVIIEACDFAHNCMPPYIFSFVIGTGASDTTPPWVVDVMPENDAVNIPIDSVISVYLQDSNEQGTHGEPSNLDIDSVKLYVDGSEVEFTFSEEDTLWIIESALVSPLPFETQITVAIDACDLAQNCMETYTWQFTTVSEDEDPPYISLTVPADGASDIPTTTNLLAIVQDDLSGVEGSSIVMYVEGRPVTDPTFFPEGNGYRILYDPAEPLPGNERIDVVLFLCDRDNNCRSVGWSFTTSAETPPPELIYPKDNSWLNYRSENGAVRFSWSNQTGGGIYRIRIYFQGITIPSIIDYGPGDYEIGFGFIMVNYPIAETQWNMLSEIDSIYWEVAEIDRVGGDERTRYSAPFHFCVAPSDCLTLISPEDFSTIPTSSPPRFRWTKDLRATAYLVGFAQIGNYGHFFENTFYTIVDPCFSEIPVSASSWALFPDGNWLWTVVPIYADDTYGNFIMFHFRKISSL